MNTKLTQISPLPVPTWHWLKINDKTIDLTGTPTADYTGDPLSPLPEGVEVSEIQDGPAGEILAGTADFVRQNKNQSISLRIRRDVSPNTPIMIDYQLEGTRLVNRMHITVEEGCQATIMVRYSGSGLHCGHTTIYAKEGSKIQLIQAQLLSNDSTHIDAIDARAHDDAEVNTLLCELGSGRAVCGCNINLPGKEAKAALNGVYFGKDTSDLDFNYRIGYGGQCSEGEIVIRGVLDGSARKVMKDTIDFLTGASGAKGREEESVLVLSDKVVNLSSPLLLCGEDNVEGEHAASIGKPDQEKLYYLMSRGLSEQESRLLLVEASLAPILNKISSDSLRDEISGYIQEVLHVRK